MKKMLKIKIKHKMSDSLISEVRILAQAIAGLKILKICMSFDQPSPIELSDDVF